MRHSIVPAVYLILKKENKILLTLRQNTGYRDGEYVVPSGHVEKGKFPSDAMLRETKEEINLDLSKEDLQLVHVMYRICNDSERVDYFYLVNFKDSFNPKNMECEKCKSIEWHDLDNLPSNTFDYVSAAIKYWRTNNFSSENLE